MSENSKRHEVTIKDILNMFEKIPFIIEEFVEGTDHGTSYGVEGSSALFSPLLSKEKMVDSAKTAAIEATLKMIPYYSYSSSEYSETGDIGELNIPRSMRGEFWGTLFRDVFGTEENSLINKIHNKLKYTHLSEEHILNRGLFKKILGHKDIVPSFPLVLQNDSKEEENLDKIISEKLNSIYSLLDYSPAQSGMIEDWISSLYLSGHLNYEMKKREENLFKIQDMKAELLRRKFAGSISLYNILLSTINRRGTFAPAIPLFSVSGSIAFEDNRLIRALDIPGITTEKKSELIIDPLFIYKGIVPDKITTSLYYGSSNYSAEDFEKNSHKYLRYGESVVAWDNLNGILDSSLVRKIYPRFDSKVGGEFIALDTLNPEENFQEYYLLDKDSRMFDLSQVEGSFFDIQADTLLFHENSLQKEMRQNYPFATYTLSGGKSLSMMDFPWLDYIDTALERKTRVQEEVDIGVQVSKLVNDPDSSVTENFAVLTFSEELSSSFEEQDGYYLPNHNYAYIWSVNITYDSSNFTVRTPTPVLISYILLSQDTSEFSPLDLDRIRAHPSYETFVNYSSGIIPFAYQNLRQEDIFNMKLFLGENENGELVIIDEFHTEEYNKALFLFTPHENVAISKRYLRKSPTDLTTELLEDNKSNSWFTRPERDEALKHIIYGISRYDEDSETEEWFWSEPLRVYPKEIINAKEYKPDWMNLTAYINPYLNMTEQCASPLRRKPVLKRALRPKVDQETDFENEITEELVGPSQKAALMNINASRGYDIYVNNEPENNPGYLRGTYFHRELRLNPGNLDRTAFLESETLQIWGDNRRIWPDENNPGELSSYALDPAEDWGAETQIRSRWTFDDLGVPALIFKKGLAYDPDLNQKHETYLDFRPTREDSDISGWEEWVWNDLGTSGFSAAFDLNIEVEEDSSLQDRYYLLSRKTDDNSSTKNAEFDFYIEFNKINSNIIPDLVLRVYPDGNKDSDLIFETRLEGIEHIKNRQSQIACSYKIESKGDLLTIEQTVVADRKWNTIYRAIEKEEGEDDYSIYETNQDFKIEGLSPLSTINFPPPYDNSDDNEEYFFGHLIKYRGDSNNSLKGINVFNEYEGYNPTFGILYDVRLYNRGMNKAETIIMSSGTRKELYSYSPSLYKLLNQFYTDPGILRRYLKPVEGKRIEKVRLFSRGVWDSIITDLHPVTEEEQSEISELNRPGYQDPKWDLDVYVPVEDGGYKLKQGVIEQTLLDTYETGRDIQFSSGTSFYYKGRKLNLADGIYSYVQTSLYPISYRNKRIDSGVDLKLNLNREGLEEGKSSYESYVDDFGENFPVGSKKINLPSAPAGESLQYRADVSLNLIVDDEIDFGAPFLKGKKLRTTLKGGEMGLSHAGGNTSKDTQDNFAILPLYIPDQSTNIVPSWHPKIYDFKFDNLVLNSAFGKFLDASYYYDELRTPIPFVEDNEYKFTSRWHGIRTLKEGEYYFTVKYPMQILPFRNSRMGKSKRYPVFYLTSRFKVVVSGSPKYYSEEQDLFKHNWVGDNLENHFENTEGSDNNKDFTRREIKIDLYSMKNSGNPVTGNWYWDKIASNWDNSNENVLKIDKEALSSPLVLNKPVNMYLTSTYQAPFFDSEGEVDYLGVSIKSLGERLITNNLDNRNEVIILRYGTSYRMLFDYTARLTELSYGEEYTSNNEISQSELDNYKYNLDLTSSDPVEASKNLSRIVYKDPGNWGLLLREDKDLSESLTGFYVNSSGEFAPINREYHNNDLAMGNPYKSSFEENLLYKKLLEKSYSREDSGNIAFIPYRVENKEVSELVAPRPFGRNNPLKVMVQDGRGYDIREPEISIEEFSHLQRIYDDRSIGINTAISKLKGSPEGLFFSFNTASPVPTETSYTTGEDVKENTHDFIAYNQKAFSLVPNSEINVSRKLFSKENKITSTFFDSPSFSGDGFYEYDAEETGNDKWTMYLGDSDTFEFSYSGLNKIPLYGEIKIRLKSSENVNLHLKYSIDGNETNGEPQEIISSNLFGDYIFDLKETKETNRLFLVFSTPGGGPLNNQKVVLDKIDLRKEETKTFNMGLSSNYISGASVTGSSPIVIDDFRLIAFKNKKNKGIFPVQVLNTKLINSLENASITTEGFIETYRLKSKSSSDTIPLYRPWVERLSYKQDDEQETNFYPFIKEMEGKNNFKLIKSSTPSSNGLFSINPGSMRFDPPSSISIGGEDSPGIIFDSNKFEKEYRMAVKINREKPFTILNEKFTMVANCINYGRFKKGVSSPVAITNIQLLVPGDVSGTSTVVYELEYFPIIYDELRHHISLNFLVRED